MSAIFDVLDDDVENPAPPQGCQILPLCRTTGVAQNDLWQQSASHKGFLPDRWEAALRPCLGTKLHAYVKDIFDGW